MTDEYDPSKHTVAEVEEELAKTNEAEAAKILEREREGKARKGLLDSDAEPSTAVRSNVDPGVDLIDSTFDDEPGEQAVRERVEELAQRYEDEGQPDAAAKLRRRHQVRTYADDYDAEQARQAAAEPA